MKLELGIHTREIQRDWYEKRGISLHGFLMIAQMDENEHRTEVIDLWSEDTKQEAWFTLECNGCWLSLAEEGAPWLSCVFIFW